MWYDGANETVFNTFAAFAEWHDITSWAVAWHIPINHLLIEFPKTMVCLANDDDDDEMFMLWLNIIVMLLGYAFLDCIPRNRNPSVFFQRLIWADYVEKHANNQAFTRHLRMDLDSFDRLLALLRPELEVDQQMAFLRGGAIIPEICLFITLRYLAGGSYLDIYDLTGVSRSSFYRIVIKTCIAIRNCDELDFKFPQTLEECQAAASGFESISYGGAINNCVGALDGYILRIVTPSREEVGNVRQYYSGHYQCYGLNIQAVCDHLCRFLFVSIAGPGSTNDRDAYNNPPHFPMLRRLIESIADGFVVVADAAYEASEYLCPMYYGANRSNPLYDNYNFFASQCRIRIEMAFGMMKMKWAILERPLRVKITNVPHVFLAITRLHNFTINERIRKNGSNGNILNDAPNELSYLPSQPMDGNGDPVFFPNEGDMLPGVSNMREAMAMRVQNLELERPAANRY